MNPKAPFAVDPETVLAFGEDFMLRYDKQDHHHLLLGLNDPVSGPTQVRIPINVWQAIHQCGVMLLTLVDTSDVHLEDMSRAMVRARMEFLNRARQMPNWTLASLGGFEAFGPEHAPVETQVQTGIESYKRLRAWEQGIHQRARGHCVRQTVSSIDFGLLDADAGEVSSIARDPSPKP